MTFNLAFQSNTTANALLDAGLIQVVGIVPTLIIVQVGLGRSVNDEPTTNDELAAQRIENNRASMANSRYSGGGGVGNYEGPGESYIASIRSARSRSSRYSNARPVSHELVEHRRSFRSVVSGKTAASSQRMPSYIDTSSMNASRRTLYDLRMSDLPPSPSSGSYLRSPPLTSLSLRSPSLRSPTSPSLRSPSSPKSLVQLPASPTTLPPSPVLEKVVDNNKAGGEGKPSFRPPFSDFGEAITRIETNESDDSMTRGGYFSAV
jgi:hypothetical protein